MISRWKTTNLIVDVLSQSFFTIIYDIGTKHRKYEQMETLQEIVFVNPFDREIIICRRTEQMNVWTETGYTSPGDIVQIDGFQIQLQEIFANLPDEK